MNEKTLYILRGVSGCGKTTLAKTLEADLPNAEALSADDYWYLDDPDVYAFDINKLGLAHKWCQDYCKYVMDIGIRENIIVHNTNTSEKEIIPYLKLADKFGYKVVSLVVENRHGNTNVHDVPEVALQRQERKLRNSIKLR